MSKYIIELGEDANMVQVISVTKSGNAYIDSTVYVGYLEQLTADYINEHFSDLQDTAYQKGLHDGESKCRYCNEYQRGLDDAWEAARKIIRMPEGDMLDLFPECYSAVCTASQVVLKYDASEVIAQLKAYEEQSTADEIKVGDEVIYIEHKFIVFATETEEHYASLFDVNGRHASASQRECKKTGRHFDIDKILEDMRG